MTFLSAHVIALYYVCKFIIFRKKGILDFESYALGTRRFNRVSGWGSIKELSYFPQQGLWGKRFLDEGLKTMVGITMGH